MARISAGLNGIIVCVGTHEETRVRTMEDNVILTQLQDQNTALVFENVIRVPRGIVRHLRKQSAKVVGANVPAARARMLGAVHGAVALVQLPLPAGPRLLPAMEHAAGVIAGMEESAGQIRRVRVCGTRADARALVVHREGQRQPLLLLPTVGMPA